MKTGSPASRGAVARAAAAAAMLLLLQLLLGSSGAMAQVQSCPIDGPVTNLTAPADIAVPSSGNMVFRLTPGTYTMAMDAANVSSLNVVQAGQTICLLGLGADRSAVQILPQPIIEDINGAPVTFLHFVLNENSTLFLSQLTLTSSTPTNGGILTQPDPDAENPTNWTRPAVLTSNNLRISNLQRTCGLVIAKPFLGRLHNTEFVDNKGGTEAGGSAVVVSNGDGTTGAVDLKFTGETLIQGNTASMSVGGAMVFRNDVLAERIKVEFDGTTRWQDNQAMGGGACYIGGGVDVKFTGQVASFSGNKATSSNDFNPNGGAIRLSTAYTSASLEFSADSVVFADNVAESPINSIAQNFIATGAAIYAVAGGAPVTVNFLSTTASFIGNAAFPNPQGTPAAGGAVSLYAYVDSDIAHTLTMNIIDSCLTFSDNIIQPQNASASASVNGAALSVASPGSDSTVVVFVNGSSQLQFGNNTVAGAVGGGADVFVGGNGSSIQCGALAAKTQGDYTVTGNMCAASGANVISGGNITSPAVSCQSGTCAGLPGSIANAAGWQCPSSEASPEGAVCSSSCLPGFIGSPRSVCTAGFWRVAGSCSGCAAPPPMGGSTLITGYASCSASPSGGAYPVGTACIAVCAPGSTDGLVQCGQTSRSGKP